MKIRTTKKAIRVAYSNIICISRERAEHTQAEGNEEVREFIHSITPK